MYQIFYIDIDEEITSVIDRLKKSKATENFFVVSPRSLILQSVVSLKLLKREAAKEKKQIAIVVNDKSAGMKVEKSGILVVSSLKGLEGGEEIKESFSSKMEIKDSEISNKNKYKNIMEKEKSSKKGRLQKVGSDSFYSDVADPSEEPSAIDPIAKSALKKNMPRSDGLMKAESGNNSLEPKNTSDIKREKTTFSYAPEINNFEAPVSEANPVAREVAKEYGPNRIGSSDSLDPYKEKLVEGFFNPELRRMNQESKVAKFENNAKQSVPVSGGIRKIIFSFIIVCLFLALGIFAYLFLPKATAVVSVKNEIKKFDVEAKGNTSASAVKISELVIPAKIVEKENSIVASFKTTGKKASASDVSQKAKGKITIYNGFDSESQQLVATTRFLSGDGKLFRLVKGTTVPGMSGGNPGSIEADVIADQPGEEYNIGASDFKIPGFEGTAKYEKFYAKSSSAMSGGGASGSGGVTVVSQSDIDNAKKDAESKLKEQLDEDVKNEIGSGFVFLPEAAERNISESSSTARANEVSGNFDYKVKGKIKAVIFSENDLRSIIAEKYSEVNKGKMIDNFSLVKVNYGASSADFSSGTININANVEVPLKNDVDWDEFKTKILGKNDEQIKETMKEYPQIEKINIDFWPSFMSQKIPQYKGRVVVEVENASN